MKGSSGRVPLLADVARVAGVSVPTVSRVLSGTAKVSAEKSERVMAAVQYLGYRPNATARALASGRRSIVSVLTGDTTLFGYASTIQGVEEAARRAGYSVVITVLESDDPQIVAATVDMALGQPVAGIIGLEYDAGVMEALKRVPRQVLSVSASGSRSGGGAGSRVSIDDREGARRATEYLLSLGHPTVHHVGVPDLGGSGGRADGWREALEAAGRPSPGLIRADWSPRSGYEIGLRLAEDPAVTAVLCGNDELAIGAIRAFESRGRSIPADVSIVGFDGQPLAEFSNPPLTTVEQPFFLLGQRAFQALERRLTSETDTTDQPLIPSLIIRESAAPFRR